MSRGNPQAQHYIECDSCDSKPAKYFCKQCTGNLCDDCRNEHSLKKLFKKHEVVLITEARSTEISEVGYCQKHPSKTYQICCKLCQVPMCPLCQLDDHNGHPVQDIGEVLQKKKNQILQQVTSIESKSIPAHENVLHAEKNQLSSVLKRIEKCRVDVKSQSERFIKLIKEVEDRDLTSLQKLEESAVQASQISQNQIELKIQQLQEIKEKLQNDCRSSPHNVLMYENEKQIADDLPKLSQITSPTFNGGVLEKSAIESQFGQLVNETAPAIEKTEAKATNRKYKMTVFDSDIEEQRGVECVGGGRVWIRGDVCLKRLEINEDGKSSLISIRLGTSATGLTVINDTSVLYSDKEDKRIIRVGENEKREVLTETEWYPMGLAPTKTGNFLACLCQRKTLNEKPQKGKVVIYSSSGSKVQEIMKDGLKNLFERPHSVTENTNEDICVSDNTKEEVIVVSKSGKKRFSYKGQKNETFWPKELDSDSQGNIFIADQYSNCLHMISSDGIFLSFLLTVSDGIGGDPMGLSVDKDGNIWVAELSSRQVKFFQCLQ